MSVSETVAQLLETMIGNKQISAMDANALRQQLERDEVQDIQSEAEILQWLAEEYHLPFSDLEDLELDRQLLSQFPARVLLKHEMLPLRRVNGTVEMAISRLFETQGLDSLRVLTGENITPVLATAESIRRQMKEKLGVGADTLDTLDKETAAFQVLDEGDEEDINLDDAAQDASIIRFVNQVLADALAQRATDVHLEPYEDEFRIRYRVDGVLLDAAVPTQIKRFQPAIVSRIKILSHLDIAEKRLPQDGRIKIRMERGDVDVRVSVIPMLHGEAVVLRLLRQDSTKYGLNELKVGDRELRMFRGVLSLPHGIMLVTGPTGSGKTTTLYAALSEINDSVRKIITIEDPIEYNLKGINQIQVSEKAGLTFGRGLRAILRHDPDVLLVGEIRDAETAQIAVQAALTGHLVFSTLHTNDAPGALTRLVDMGVEPYLVASSLEAVLAQRLVRVLCDKCKKEDHSRAAQVFRREIGFPQETPLYQMGGCEECRMTGYRGRRGVFEMMGMNDEIREKLMSSCSSVTIREVANRHGLRSLSEDGWRVVAEGATTVDEVLRVTKDERLSGGIFLTED
jgi:general secretion pathway protein E/type IV pilus assembly protein PilB